MLWLALVVIVLVVLAVLVIKLKQPEGRAAGYPYDRQVLFSPAERSLRGVLDQAVGGDYRVFGKVRVADVVAPKRGMESSSRQKAFNRISAKHFDFVLCTKSDLAIVCAIELDDRSHQQPKRQARDAFLIGLCHSVSLPLIQVSAQRAYSVHELRATVLGVLSQHQEQSVGCLPQNVSPAPPVVSVEPVVFVQREIRQPEAAEPEAPVCPKCGSMMVRRQAKAGSNAGCEFWGCSTFPKCRGILEEAPANAAESMA